MHWTRASLVVLALLALVVAPGTIFAVAAAPDSDLVPVRGFRRLTQTTNDGGVEYLQRTKLNATDGAAYDYFGVSVSIDGDTVVIAAYQDDDKGSNSGSAYVFTRATAGDLASGWTQLDDKLTAGDGAAGDQFGKSVSIDGDTMVIGAFGDADKGSNSGSAYVYTRDTAGDLASGWTQVAKLTAGDGADSDNFGYSVSIDGSTIVVGAYYDDVKGSDSGSAHVFTRVTAGDPASGWTQVAKLNATDGAAGDEFGYSVSIDGDTVVIGAHYDNDPVKGYKSGSAYVFSIHFPPCDASSPPANGAVGDCTGHLASGSTCQPACDAGYAPIGPTVCDNGVLTPTVCSTYCDASGPPANGEVGNCTEYLLSGTTCQPTCEEYHTVSGVTTCEDGTITRTRCDGPCDASAPPANGGAGNCTDKLMRGTECQPTCDEHYTVSGVSKCEGGTLIPAQCLGHLVLFLQQAEGVQRAGDVRAPGLHDAAAAAASTAAAYIGCGWYYLLCRWIQDSYVHNYGPEYVYGDVWWYY